jgi:hypothetical protein
MHQSERMLRRRHSEVCVFAHLAAEVKSGAISIPVSEEYADSRELLLSREACGPLIADYCRELELPRTATAFVARLQAWLTETARQVDVGYPANAQLVVDAHGQPRLKSFPRRNNAHYTN